MGQFLQLLIFLTGLIVLVRASNFLSDRIGLSPITLQLLVGILLGPSLLNLTGAAIILGSWGSPSPSLLHGVLKTLAEIGLIQLMFMAGLHVDWDTWKTTFKSISSLAGWGFVSTAVGTAIISRSFFGRWSEALALSAIMAASSFGISAYGLNKIMLLRSRTSQVILGSAVMGSLLAIILMVASMAVDYAILYGMLNMTIAVSWFLGKLIMFSAICYFLTSRFLKLARRKGLQERPRQILVGYLLLVASLYAWATVHFGSFAAVGVASLGGGLLSMSNLGLKERLIKGFESVGGSLPVGILFIIVGMGVNLKELREATAFLVILLIGVIGARLTGFWIANHKPSDPLEEKGVLCFSALPQGEMGILIAGYLLSRGLVSPSSFNVALTAVVFLTLAVPTLIKTVEVSCRDDPHCSQPIGPKGVRE
jgi:Kef-type K+ transport system membrane component KefB